MASLTNELTPDLVPEDRELQFSRGKCNKLEFFYRGVTKDHMLRISTNENQLVLDQDES